MLLLTRKIGEGIHIGPDVEIVVMSIQGKQVRLGIKAPESTEIWRNELMEKENDKK